MHPLSLSHLSMIDAHPLELVDAAAAGHFSYCGLRIVAPTTADPVADVVGDPVLADRIGKRLATTGVELLDIEAVWLQPHTEVKDLLPALETGRRLGARHVLTVGHDPERSRLLDNFGRLCACADALGLGVALEFIAYCAIGTLDGALSLIADSGAENASLLIDALQFHRSGATADDLSPVDPALLRYIQLCDAPVTSPATVQALRAEARTDRRLPGEGELPLRPLLDRMPPGIPISVEAPTLVLRGLPYDEQATIIAATTRRFLAEKEI